jgi:hypothetical protein
VSKLLAFSIPVLIEEKGSLKPRPIVPDHRQASDATSIAHLKMGPLLLPERHMYICQQNSQISGLRCMSGAGLQNAHFCLGNKLWRSRTESKIYTSTLHSFSQIICPSHENKVTTDHADSRVDLLVKLHIISRKQSLLAAVVTKPPVVVWELL